MLPCAVRARCSVLTNLGPRAEWRSRPASDIHAHARGTVRYPRSPASWRRSRLTVRAARTGKTGPLGRGGRKFGGCRPLAATHTREAVFACLDLPRCLAFGDGVHEALDVVALDRGNRPAAQQRLDVTLDPAAIGRERRRLFRGPPARQQPARLSVGEVSVAQLGNRRRLARGAILGRRVRLDNLAQDAPGFGAGTLGCPGRARRASRWYASAAGPRPCGNRRDRRRPRFSGAARQSLSLPHPRSSRPASTRTLPAIQVAAASSSPPPIPPGPASKQLASK
jgi:hypothetical protein